MLFAHFELENRIWWSVTTGHVFGYCSFCATFSDSDWWRWSNESIEPPCLVTCLHTLLPRSFKQIVIPSSHLRRRRHSTVASRRRCRCEHPDWVVIQFPSCIAADNTQSAGDAMTSLLLWRHAGAAALWVCSLNLCINAYVHTYDATAQQSLSRNWTLALNHIYSCCVRYVSYSLPRLHDRANIEIARPANIIASSSNHLDRVNGVLVSYVMLVTRSAVRV